MSIFLLTQKRGHNPVLASLICHESWWEDSYSPSTENCISQTRYFRNYYAGVWSYLVSDHVEMCLQLWKEKEKAL